MTTPDTAVPQTINWYCPKCLELNVTSNKPPLVCQLCGHTVKPTRTFEDGPDTGETDMNTPDTAVKPDAREIARELEATMQCNCDLDNWQPERDTGHSWVCRIHKEAKAIFVPRHIAFLEQQRETSPPAKSTAVQLKPCPFCSRHASAGPWAGRHKVACLSRGCPVRPNITGDTPEQAAEAWNTRATIPTAPLEAVQRDAAESAYTPAIGINAGAFLRAFERNCSQVRLSSDEKDELHRLFWESLKEGRRRGNKQARAALNTNAEDGE